MPRKSKKGLFVGKSHKEGGIPSEVVETGQLLEIEGQEYYICREAYNSDEVLDLKQKTNKEVLDYIYTTHSCKLIQSKMNAGDFIVCKLVVKDSKKRDWHGTIEEIVNTMQKEKSCKVENRNAILQQGGILENDNFRDWFKGSVVVDEDNEPLIVYHGTTHDFDSFKLERGNVENAVGIGYYFTSNPEDASANYAGVGADLTSRISLKAEEYQGDFQFNYSLDDLVDEFGITEEDAEKIKKGEHPELSETLAKRKARRDLKGGHDGAIIPAYIKIEKPYDMTSDKKMFIVKDEEYYMEMAEDEVDKEDFEDEDEPSGYDEEQYKEALNEKSNEIYLQDYSPSEDGEGVALNDAAQKVFYRYEGTEDFPIYEIKDRFADGMTTKEFYDFILDGAKHARTDDRMHAAANQLFNDIIREAGYDGVIQDAYEEFVHGRKYGQPMDGIEWGDRHYIVFEPTQIKSAIGNNGDFDPYNDSIIMATGGRAGGSTSYDRWLETDWSSHPESKKLYRLFFWAYDGRIDYFKMPNEKDVEYLQDSLKDLRDRDDYIEGFATRLQDLYNDWIWLEKGKDDPTVLETMKEAGVSPKVFESITDDRQFKKIASAIVWDKEERKYLEDRFIGGAELIDRDDAYYFLEDRLNENSLVQHENGDWYSVDDLLRIHDELVDKYPEAVFTEEQSKTQLDLFAEPEKKEDVEQVIRGVEVLIKNTKDKKKVKELKQVVRGLKMVA